MNQFEKKFAYQTDDEWRRQNQDRIQQDVNQKSRERRYTAAEREVEKSPNPADTDPLGILQEQALLEDKLREQLPAEVRLKIKEKIIKILQDDSFKFIEEGVVAPLGAPLGRGDMHEASDKADGLLPTKMLIKGFVDTRNMYRPFEMDLSKMREIFIANIAEAVSNFGSPDAVVEKTFQQLLFEAREYARNIESRAVYTEDLKFAVVLYKHADAFEKHAPEAKTMIRKLVNKVIVGLTRIGQGELVILDNSSTKKSPEFSTAQEELEGQISVLTTMLQELPELSQDDTKQAQRSKTINDLMQTIKHGIQGGIDLVLLPPILVAMFIFKDSYKKDWEYKINQKR